MYAIVEIGRKQYKVQEKDIINVEKQKVREGKDIVLNKVALLSKGDKKIEIGTPFLKDVKLIATVVRHIKAKKVISYKYRRRNSSHWKKGHRQQLTRLIIKEIQTG